MATTRMAKTSDATWCRAWVCDTTAERTALAATWSDPLGPKRGDEVLDNQDGQLYMFTNGGGMYKISGGAYLPIDLNSDVVNILPVANGGTGDNTIAQGDLYYGSASGVVSRLAKNTSATRYLSNTGTSNNPAYAQVDLTNGVTGDLPFANLAQGSALSVLGVTGNATADNASIVAASDGQVIRRSGTAVGFGAINLASANAITGLLPVANGGTDAGQSISFNAANFLGTGGLTWTVTSPQVTTNRVVFSNGMMFWTLIVSASSTSGSPEPVVQVVVPLGKSITNFTFSVGKTFTGGVSMGTATEGSGSTLNIRRLDGGNFAAPDGVFYIYLNVIAEAA